jgi:hypothetical protein
LAASIAAETDIVVAALIIRKVEVDNIKEPIMVILKGCLKMMAE